MKKLLDPVFFEIEFELTPVPDIIPHLFARSALRQHLL